MELIFTIAGSSNMAWGTTGALTNLAPVDRCATLEAGVNYGLGYYSLSVLPTAAACSKVSTKWCVFTRLTHALGE